MPMKKPFTGFRRHPELEGRHAVFGASQYSWLRYNREKFIQRFANHRKAQEGTDLHNWAHETIRLGRKQARSNNTLCMYINDCIGHRMKNEVVLYYSPWFFGSADACKLDESPSLERPVLRIFDLKTGENKASEDQLIIYAAFFCLEYDYDPFDLDFDLRLYQSDARIFVEVDPQDVMDAMIQAKSGTEIILENEEVL